MWLVIYIAYWLISRVVLATLFGIFGDPKGNEDEGFLGVVLGIPVLGDLVMLFGGAYALGCGIRNWWNKPSIRPTRKIDEIL